MARDFRSKYAPQTPRRREEETPRFVKRPSKTKRNNDLRYALRHGDTEALEDWDEWEP